MTENQNNSEKGRETGEIISIAAHRRSDQGAGGTAGTQGVSGTQSRNYPERGSAPVHRRAQRTVSRTPGQAAPGQAVGQSSAQNGAGYQADRHAGQTVQGQPSGHKMGQPAQHTAQPAGHQAGQARQEYVQARRSGADPVRIARVGAQAAGGMGSNMASGQNGINGAKNPNAQSANAQNALNVQRNSQRADGREITERRSADSVPADATVVRPAIRPQADRSSALHSGSAGRPGGGRGSTDRGVSKAGSGSRNGLKAKNVGKKGTGKGANGKKKKGEDNTALSSLVKAIIYITCVLVVSGLLGYFGISIGNDVFAFVKDDFEVSITMSEATTLDEAADILHEKGVINYPGIFKFYSKLRKKTWQPISGECKVSPSMSYDALFAAFQYQKPEATTVSITIPEGYTVDEIIDLFVNKYNIGTKEGFVDAIQNGEYDYWFVKELDNNAKPGRKYRLEGYLYPDTYYFYSTASPTSVISKILDNFNVKMRQVLGKDWETTCAELCAKRNMTFDEIVILASLIQMEAKYEYEYEDVSAVFTNRLNNRSISNGLLQSDATIQYFLDERNEDLTQDQLDTDNPYNTYLYPGLPPGPITNITINAINYAFYPSDAKYCYFIAHPDGYTMFSVTYSEFLANKAMINEIKAGRK